MTNELKTKICPLMSGMDQTHIHEFGALNINGLRPCIQADCALWRGEVIRTFSEDEEGNTVVESQTDFGHCGLRGR